MIADDVCRSNVVQPATPLVRQIQVRRFDLGRDEEQGESRTADRLAVGRLLVAHPRRQPVVQNVLDQMLRVDLPAGQREQEVGNEWPLVVELAALPARVNQLDQRLDQRRRQRVDSGSNAGQSPRQARQVLDSDALCRMDEPRGRWTPQLVRSG